MMDWSNGVMTFPAPPCTGSTRESPRGSCWWLSGVTCARSRSAGLRPQRDHDRALKRPGLPAVGIDLASLWPGVPFGSRRRQQTGSDKTTPVHLKIKAGFGMIPCRATGIVTGRPKLSGATIGDRVFFCGEGSSAEPWRSHRHRAPRRRARQWIHVGIGKASPKIRAVVVTASTNGDTRWHAANPMPDSG